MSTRASDAVRALAEADFAAIADRFANAGFIVQVPARGIVQIKSPVPDAERLSLLISVGVHGDETAPIEIVAQLLDELSATPRELAVDLMVVVGNLNAIAQGKRFLDADMNRLFRSDRGDLQAAVEAQRADVIMHATTTFFADAAAKRWHLDMHTAIRPSLYPTFAIMPDLIAEEGKTALTAWLGSAGIAAIVLNPKPAGTFSSYTASNFGTTSCTAELGQVGALGKNDLSVFADTNAALNALLRSGQTSVSVPRPPKVFTVAQEIVKQCEDFRMAFDGSTQNFTPMAPGSIIAYDGEHQYRVGVVTEYVVFPNSNVRVGLRAGLMVVPRD